MTRLRTSESRRKIGPRDRVRKGLTQGGGKGEHLRARASRGEKGGDPDRRGAKVPKSTCKTGRSKGKNRPTYRGLGSDQQSEALKKYLTGTTGGPQKDLTRRVK